MKRTVLVGLACALAACQGGEPRCEPDGAPESSAAVTRFPGVDWETDTPASAGLDAAALDDAAAYSASINGQCLVVAHDGRIVFERYAHGADATSTQKAWSITKSISATMLGVAQRLGKGTCVDRPVHDWVPQWSDAGRAQIKLSHVLSHTTGLEFDQINDILYPLVSGDYTADARALMAHDPPGTVYHYSNMAVQMLEPVLREALGEDPSVVARRELWDPIGVAASLEWEHDAAGHVPTYAGVHLSCRDLARLGLLYLNGGTWAGRPIVTPGFVRAATTPSQSVDAAVGFLWWLNGQAPTIAPGGMPITGPLLPHAPVDAYAALGLGQNFVDVLPTARTVIVHMRPAPQDMPGAMGNDELLMAFMRDGPQYDHDEILKRMKLVP